jgi:hypothetical protein
MFREWQETIQGPTQAYEAKFFTLQTAFDAAEAEREGEFSLMKEIMSKIVSALEDKAGSDLISMSGFKDAHMA